MAEQQQQAAAAGREQEHGVKRGREAAGGPRLKKQKQKQEQEQEQESAMQWMDRELGLENEEPRPMVKITNQLMRDVTELRSVNPRTRNDRRKLKARRDALARRAQKAFGKVPRWVKQLCMPPETWLADISEIPRADSSASEEEEEEEVEVAAGLDVQFITCDKDDVAGGAGGAAGGAGAGVPQQQQQQASCVYCHEAPDIEMFSVWYKNLPVDELPGPYHRECVPAAFADHCWKKYKNLPGTQCVPVTYVPTEE